MHMHRNITVTIYKNDAEDHNMYIQMKYLLFGLRLKSLCITIYTSTA